MSIKNQNDEEPAFVVNLQTQATGGGGKTARTDSDPILLARVLAEEFEEITGKAIVGEPLEARSIDGKPSAGPSLDSVFRQFHAENLTALCFSGGGIRSATFGLGIVQKLAERGLLEKFDYLSTVSGGGYLGSWLSAWIRRERVKSIIDPTLDVKSIPLPDRPAYRESCSAERNVIDEARLYRDTGIKAVQAQINCIKNKSDQFPTPGRWSASIYATCFSTGRSLFRSSRPFCCCRGYSTPSSALRFSMVDSDWLP